MEASKTVCHQGDDKLLIFTDVSVMLPFFQKFLIKDAKNVFGCFGVKISKISILRKSFQNVGISKITVVYGLI